jgi:IS5 family transposase
LEAHKLGAALLAKVGELLQAQGLRFSGGTIIDATLIEAPSSTQNREKARDPDSVITLAYRTIQPKFLS